MCDRGNRECKETEKRRQIIDKIDKESSNFAGSLPMRHIYMKNTGAVEIYWNEMCTLSVLTESNSSCFRNMGKKWLPSS